MNGNLLSQVSHCAVGDFHRVSVEQLTQGVTLGDGAVLKYINLDTQIFSFKS